MAMTEYGASNTILLMLSPEEAAVVEQCLKREDLTEFRWFLLKLGECLVSGQTTTIDVSEENLWFLRDRVDPLAGAGLGLDIIKKLYYFLLQLNPKYDPAKDIGLSRAIQKFVESLNMEGIGNGNGSTSEGTDRGTADSPTTADTEDAGETAATD